MLQEQKGHTHVLSKRVETETTKKRGSNGGQERHVHEEKTKSGRRNDTHKSRETIKRRKERNKREISATERQSVGNPKTNKILKNFARCGREHCACKQRERGAQHHNAILLKDHLLYNIVVTLEVSHLLKSPLKVCL